MRLTEFKTLRYEEVHNIATIWINMPPANKMIPEFFEEIVCVIDEYALNSETKGIIICGKGRHFSSGADVKQLLGMIKDNTVIKKGNIISYPEWYIKCKQAFNALYMSNKLIVSAISGFCVGSGFELALSAHFIICEKNARVGLPETTFGLLPGVNGTLRMSEKIGMKKAFEFIMKGELMTGEEAYRAGLVDSLVEKREAYEYAEKFINYLYDNREKCNEFNKREIWNKFMKI